MMSEKKSVSFSSTPLERSKHIKCTPDCLGYMTNGSDFIKLNSNGRQYKRTYYLDFQSKELKWHPTNKKKSKAKISFDDICEVRWGIVRATSGNSNTTGGGVSSVPSSVMERSFTVVYGSDYELLCLVANSAEEANIWITGLTRLVAACRNNSISFPCSLDDVLGDTAFMDSSQNRDKWLREVFSEADSQNKGFLNELDVIHLMKSLNSGVTTVRIKHKLKEVDITRRSDRGRLSSADFVCLFKEISTRPEIFFLLVRYSSNGEYLTVDDLLLFLEAEQGNTSVTKNHCYNLIQRYEPSPDNKNNNQLGIDGFTAYLVSNECDIFDKENLEVCQDMSQPLPHYFIAASFNTYLTQNQLKGPSCVNGFMKALSLGCRFIKMDIWDGLNDEPIIYHGGTLTTKLSLRKALEVIHNFAFVCSEYPLLITIQNYCSPKQQYTVMRLIKEIFKNELWCPAVDSESNYDSTANPFSCTECYNWPSPEQLKRRIILVGKKLMPSESLSNLFLTNSNQPQDSMEYGYVSEEDENECEKHVQSRNKKSSSRMKLIKQLSDLITFHVEWFDEHQHLPAKLSLSTTQLASIGGSSPSSQQLIHPDWDTVAVQQPLSPQQQQQKKQLTVRIMTESVAVRLCNTGLTVQSLINHNRENLVCVYPNKSRVDSSNYGPPQDLWSCGFQAVALNYQTAGLMMDLNCGFFTRNGKSGYVLKPELMRHQLLLDMKHHKDVIPDELMQTLHIRIISAQQLPKPKHSASKGDVIDPYVVVQLYGAPSDCCEERTKTVHGNANNPVFDESFEFEVSVTELALVRFLVLDDDSIGDNFIGQYTIPFECIQTGYRHVNLLSFTGEILPKSHLFVHVAVTNKRGGGKKTKRGRSLKTRQKKYTSQLKKLGIPNVDDIFKNIQPALKDAFDLRQSLHKAISDLRDSCNLPQFCNVKQCIRAIINSSAASMTTAGSNNVCTALMSSSANNVSNNNNSNNSSNSSSNKEQSIKSPSIININMEPAAGSGAMGLLVSSNANSLDQSSPSSSSLSQSQNTPSSTSNSKSFDSFNTPFVSQSTLNSTYHHMVLPVVMIIGSNNIPRLEFSPNESAYQFPELVKRSIRIFDDLMLVCEDVLQNGSSLLEKINNCRNIASEYFNNIPEIFEQNEVRSERKTIRLAEYFAWNLRLLHGQCDMISQVISDATDYVQAAKDAGMMTSLLAI